MNKVFLKDAPYTYVFSLEGGVFMLKGFIIKLIMTTVIVTVVYQLFFGYPLGSTLLLSLIFTVIAYIGDLVIMPRISHLLALGTDFILAFIGLALLSWLLYSRASIPWLPALIAALIITLAEIFFHHYLLGQKKIKRIQYS